MRSTARAAPTVLVVSSREICTSLRILDYRTVDRLEIGEIKFRSEISHLTSARSNSVIFSMHLFIDDE